MGSCHLEPASSSIYACQSRWSVPASDPTDVGLPVKSLPRPETWASGRRGGEFSSVIPTSFDNRRAHETQLTRLGLPCLGSKRQTAFRACPLLPRRTPNVRVAVTLLCRASLDNSPTRCSPTPCAAFTALGSHTHHRTRTIEMGV